MRRYKGASRQTYGKQTAMETAPHRASGGLSRGILRLYACLLQRVQRTNESPPQSLPGRAFAVGSAVVRRLEHFLIQLETLGQPLERYNRARFPAHFQGHNLARIKPYPVA